MEYLGLKIDLEKDKLFDGLGLKRLKESYMKLEETSPQERFAFVSKTFGTNLEHAQRLYDYASKHWLSFSTPILSFGRSNRGQAISCFVNFLDDTSEGLIENLSETNWLSMFGGGVGIGIGIRSSDEKSTGVMAHLKTYDASSSAYKQGSTRRGSYAAYLDISHPDIIPFIEMRKPTGDPNIRCLNLHHAVNITDDFMQIIENCMLDPEAKDDWELKDPHTNIVKEVVSAKYLWQIILDLRMHTGEPYLHFIDTSNSALPEFQRKKGLKINSLNLCAEVALATNKDRTAVCCLSSLNLEKYDDWKDDTLFIHDVAEMLDNVLEHFIKNAPDSIKRAKFSAQQERSIGVGTLGFHAYLQQKGIPFEGPMAKSINNKLFKHIDDKMTEASLNLGKTRGSPPDAKGTGQRFSHKTAIAPNATSSLIMGNTSPSIEPFRANAYRQDTLSGAYFTKNKYLDLLLKTKVKDENELADIWSSIISNDGSVQHLTELSDYEKLIFKTAMEIDQRWIVELAADRQKYIDQSQSVNVFFRPDSNIKYIHAVHFMAWKNKLKSLYYCRSEKIGKSDKISKKIERQVIKELDLVQIAQGDSCLACE